MIVGQAAKLAGIGVAIGVVVALPLAPLLDSQLYGVRVVRPDDVRRRAARAAGRSRHWPRWCRRARRCASIRWRRCGSISAECGVIADSPAGLRFSATTQFLLQPIDEPVELRRHGLDGLRLAEIDAGVLQQRHRMIRPARLQQLQVAIDRGLARRAHPCCRSPPSASPSTQSRSRIDRRSTATGRSAECAPRCAARAGSGDSASPQYSPSSFA